MEERIAELLQLSPDKRLEIITLLAQSLKNAAAPTPGQEVGAAPKNLLDFAGAWTDMSGTDEEIITQIRAARTFTRPEILLD